MAKAKLEKPSSADRYAFTITQPGAQHRGKRDGKWVTWGTGDQIDLTMEQYRSGNYNNLRLEGPLVGGRLAKADLSKAALKEGEVLVPEVNPVVKTKVTDATRVADGTEVDLETGEPNNEDGEDEDKDDAEDTDDDTGAEDNAEQKPAVSKRKLNKLIKAVEDSSGSSEFAEARAKVVEADVFPEGEMPTRKAELLQALITLRDGNEEDDGE